MDGAFTDIAELAGRCSFIDCTHTHEPRCAVRQAVEDRTLDPGRYESYQKLRRELEYQESRSDPRAARERKERDQRIHRAFGKRQRRRKEL